MVSKFLYFLVLIVVFLQCYSAKSKQNSSKLLKKLQNCNAEKEIRQKYRDAEQKAIITHFEKLYYRAMYGQEEEEEGIYISKTIVSNSICEVTRVFKDCKLINLKDDRDVITSFHNGRLGNQMSSYATLYGIGRREGSRPMISFSQYDILARYFVNITSLPIIEKEICDPCETLRWIYNVDSFGDFGSKPRGVSYGAYLNDVTMYRDYIQSDLKRNDFVFKPDILKQARNIIQKIESRYRKRISDTSQQITLVGVHVRRTDYHHHLKVFSGTMSDKSYFKRAISTFRSRYPDRTLLFLIISDDPRWVRKHLIEGDDVFYAGSIEDTPDSIGVDLAILSLCHLNILSHGTYGMWGALLNGGETIMMENNMHENIALKRANLVNWTFIF